MLSMALYARRLLGGQGRWNKARTLSKVPVPYAAGYCWRNIDPNNLINIIIYFTLTILLNNDKVVTIFTITNDNKSFQ